MQVRFWGTRGSIAKSGPDTMRYGGNTSCVEVVSDAGARVVIDCGTGAHDLGQALVSGQVQPVNGSLLISHTHWDHIQGFPFFAPLFVPGNTWNIYAPHGLSQSVREALAGQMQYTYFPVKIEDMGATIHYHDLLEGTFEVDGIHVQAQYLNHPALTLGYRLEVDGAAVVYACDHEPHGRQPERGPATIGAQERRHVNFLKDADLVIHDAQYTAAEYANKIGWGHSTAEYAVAACQAAGAKRLALTHHDPLRDDDCVDRIVAGIRAELDGQDDAPQVFAAAEGQTIELRDAAKAGQEAAGKEDAFPAVMPLTHAVGQHTILLGQLEPAAGALIAAAAGAEGADMVTVRDAGEAARVIDSDRPSLAIVDVRRASADAADICRTVCESGVGAPQVPVVVIADRFDEDSEIAAHTTDWLIPPFSEEYVRTRIRAWLLRTTCRWIRARLPRDEERRLATLKKLSILDTEPEERFDLLARIAAGAFDVPIALVSLIDRERQWFKSCIGLDARESHRDAAFCAHAILDEEVLIVPDAFLDDRFAENPFVTGGPRIRFYAGYPLKVADGSLIGTLCIIDSRPRQFSEAQIALLRDLGRLVERELEAPFHSA